MLLLVAICLPLMGLVYKLQFALYFCRRSASAWLAVWHSRYSSRPELLNMQQAVNTGWSMVVL